MIQDGYSLPKPEVIPRPTSWPAGLAFGIALFGWGVISSTVILGIGTVVFVSSLVGWIGEIRNER